MKIAFIMFDITTARLLDRGVLYYLFPKNKLVILKAFLCITLKTFNGTPFSIIFEKCSQCILIKGSALAIL